MESNTRQFFLPVVPSTAIALYPHMPWREVHSTYLDVSETACVLSSVWISTALAFDVNMNVHGGP